MGKKRKNRKRHLTNINTSAIELSNAMPMAYQSVNRPTIIRPTSLRRSLLPHPGQGYRFSDIPSRFPLNSGPRRWPSPIPFWHARYVFPPVRVPVAIVPPLPGVQIKVNAANANPIPSTSSAPNSIKSSGTKALAEETSLPVTSSKQTATDPVTVQPTSHQDTKSSLNATDPVTVQPTTNQNTKSSLNSTDPVTVQPTTNQNTKSLLNSTDPVTVQPTTNQNTKPSLNAEGHDIALNTEAPNEVDDVVYLYRVEPEKGKLIEVVDLSEDQNETPSNRNLVLSSRDPSSCKETETKQGLNNKSSPNSEEVLEIYSSISVLEKSTGSGLPTQAGRKRKREENTNTHCSVCHRDYEGACKDNILLFISKCGHIFCLTCLRSLAPYKCTECNAGISNLCKIIF